MQATKRQTAREKRPVSAPLVKISIAEELARLKSEPEWLSGDRNSVTLVNTADMGVVLIVLRQGATICGHQLERPITVQVLSGGVRFTADAETHMAGEGDVLALRRSIPHDLEATSESALLLTIAHG